MNEQTPGLNLIQRAMQFQGAGAVDLGAAMPLERSVDFRAPPPIDMDLRPDRQPSPEARPAAGMEVAFNHGNCRERKILIPGNSDIEVRNEFRTIKRRLLQSLNQSAAEADYPNVVLVTSSRPAEGKTFVSLNLALTLADERDLQILLMEGDVVNPSLSQYFASGRAREGLSELLNGQASLPEDVIHPCEGVSNLSVMFAGSSDPRSPELMASPRMPEILAQLHRNWRNLLVVIDCSPVIAPEPAALAPHVDHTILVVGAEQTTPGELQDAIGQVAPCRNVSLVFNKSPRWRKRASYYGYGYGEDGAQRGGAQLDLGVG
jgi:receptor protein-tyrosine kinase